MAKEKEGTPITITFGAILRTIAVLVCLWALYLLRDLVLVILVSVVIASAIEPFARRAGKYGIPRVAAVVGIYILLFGVFLSIIPFLIFPVVVDLSEIGTMLPAKVEHIGLLPDQQQYIASVAGSLASHLSFDTLFAGVKTTLASLQQGFIQTASLIFGGFFSFIIILVISFYLSVQAGGIENFLRLVTPLGRESYVLDLWHRVRDKIGLWMQGQLLLGLIIGILVFLGLTIMQVKYALLLAILAAVFELIPFFGPILSAVPAVLLGFSSSPTLGFVVIGFYIIIQQFENHLIYPLVVKKIVNVPALVVILALLVGAKLAGFLGLILAVPAAAVLMELLEDFDKSKHRA